MSRFHVNLRRNIRPEARDPPKILRLGPRRASEGCHKSVFEGLLASMHRQGTLFWIEFAWPRLRLNCPLSTLRKLTCSKKGPPKRIPPEGVTLWRGSMLSCRHNLLSGSNKQFTFDTIRFLTCRVFPKNGVHPGLH